ncbi:MAG: hypothetical protein KGK08_04915 [Acidobacteriota bacterium]|nr:hypothetical protein [Acidobacteriota bacterium]
MKKLAFLLVVIAILYFAFRDDTPKPHPRLYSTSSDPNADGPDADDSSTAIGDWGSGHQAGYDWAKDKDIDDEDDCDIAGDNSNSPSFAEGCKDYVEENHKDYVEENQ